MSTPAPNAITEAATRCGTRANQATSAPSTRAPPAARPQSPAWSQIGTAQAPARVAAYGSWVTQRD